MFCFGFTSKKNKREVEQKYSRKVLKRLDKKGYLKPGFIDAMYKNSDSQRFLFKPEELIRGFPITGSICTICFDFNFYEVIHRDTSKHSNYRRVTCFGVPSYPLIPVTLWNEEYYNLNLDKQRELLFSREIRSINVSFSVSENTFFYDDKTGYFLNVGLTESEFNKIWELKSSSNVVVETHVKGEVYIEPDIDGHEVNGLELNYIDCNRVINGNDSCNTRPGSSIMFEFEEVLIKVYEQRESYDEALSGVFESRLMASL